jgi:hypothetical protein
MATVVSSPVVKQLGHAVDLVPRLRTDEALPSMRHMLWLHCGHLTCGRTTHIQVSSPELSSRLTSRLRYHIQSTLFCSVGHEYGRTDGRTEGGIQPPNLHSPNLLDVSCVSLQKYGKMERENSEGGSK